MESSLDNVLLQLGYEAVHNAISFHGGQGMVSKIRRIKGNVGEYFALKQLRKDEHSAMEVKLLKEFRGNKFNLCSSIHDFVFGNKQFIIMKYYPANLKQFQEVVANPLDENDAQDIAQKIWRSISYLHSQNFIHRDLKLENILLDCSESDWNAFKVNRNVKYLLEVKNINFIIADLGIAKLDDTITHTQVYSIYNPPEVNSEAFVGSLADIYQFGAIWYCLLEYKKHPKEPLTFTRNQSRFDKAIIRKTLEKNPLERSIGYELNSFFGISSIHFQNVSVKGQSNEDSASTADEQVQIYQIPENRQKSTRKIQLMSSQQLVDPPQLDEIQQLLMKIVQDEKYDHLIDQFIFQYLLQFLLQNTYSEDTKILRIFKRSSSDCQEKCSIDEAYQRLKHLYSRSHEYL